jgi:hypothetical protein
VTVQNGALTALVAILDMILYLSTDKPYHIALSFLMPKLYSNTILSSLNARSTRLAQGEADHGLGKTEVMQRSAAVSGGRVSSHCLLLTVVISHTPLRAQSQPTEIRFGRTTDLSALDTHVRRPEASILSPVHHEHHKLTGTAFFLHTPPASPPAFPPDETTAAPSFNDDDDDNDENKISLVPRRR